MNIPKKYEGTQGNITPATLELQEAKKEKLAAALRANLRRRKAAATDDTEGA